MVVFLAFLAWVSWAYFPLSRYVKTFEPENGLDIMVGLFIAALIVISGPIGFIVTYKKDK